MATTGWLTMLSLVLLAVIVIRMNQDEFLSRITGTARRWYGVSADSITTLVLVFLPLLLVLASQLPGGEVLYGWIMPLLENVSAR